jgi:hypothetical protein
MTNMQQPGPRDLERRLKEQGLMLTRLKREREQIEEDLVAAQLDSQLTGDKYLRADDKRTKVRMELERLTTFIKLRHWSTHPKHKRRPAYGCDFCAQIASAEKVKHETGPEF